MAIFFKYSDAFVQTHSLCKVHPIFLPQMMRLCKSIESD